MVDEQGDQSGAAAALGLVSEEPAGDRWFGERLISNAYLWACLVATGLYAVYDRRVQRQLAEAD